MSRAKEATASLEDVTQDGVEVEAPTETSARSGAPDRYVFALLVLQAATVAGLIWLAPSVAELSANQQAYRQEHTARVQALSDQTAEMLAEHRALKKEVADLRAVVASRVSGDVLFLKIMIAKPKIDHALARQIAESIQHYSMLYEQDPDLVLAMIKVESDFDPYIVSQMGATGLMQVMPQWRKVLAIEGELTDVDTSIKYGLQILGFYKEMYKDLEMALTAYNRGPGQVDAALMRGSDPTNKYAPRVLAEYGYFRALNQPPS
ncbi:MAG: lytic transglycosylase domain-containing protein [Myxococcales bacterium]|nr:lytic transglycosylase domain-containing protein [Myxococcales bacterium]MCB9652153.1 lytic transglycosylase domain-containing protein [Deltaproteobacteria bacterium]